MRKQTHFKKVVSLAVAAAMAVSVCTAALAEDATNEANGQTTVSEQQVEEEPSENDVAAGTTDATGVATGYSADETVVQQYTTLQEAINAEGVTKVVLNENVTEDITVPETKSGDNMITLDLAGHTLTNKTAAHTIYNKGKVVITGNGTVDNVNHGKAALYNEKDATAIIMNGTFTRSQETGVNASTSGGNSWYVVYNDGDMTFYNGKVTSTGKFSSLIVTGQKNTGANLTINDGEYDNGFIVIKVEAESGATNINGGTFNSPEQTVQSWGVTNITGGTLNGDVTSWVWKDTTNNGVNIDGIATINGNLTACNYDNAGKVASINIVSGAINGKLLKRNVNDMADADYEGATFSVCGGTFSEVFDKAYLKEGYSLTKREDGRYLVDRTPAPTPTPAPTAAPVEIKPAAPVVNDTALKDVTPEEKEKLVKAAESATISESKELANNETVQNVAKSADEYIAADGTVKDTLKEDILKAADAPETLKQAAKANVSNITLVSAPYLAVTPQKSEDGTLVFDIKLYCALKATTDPDNMTAANTCTLKTEKVEDAPVMNITLDVSKAYSGNELNTLYVRHVTESGAVYYYKAYSKGYGIIEFTNPHGFSTFTVLSDTRVAKVKLAGKEYGYDIAGIGVEFPHPDMPGYAYKGYQFDGISGSYTTLTEELFNKLAAAGKTVSATATFSAIATPAPAAAPEATAAPTATPAPTPDDSQYYTCKDCGHHNWTATADGYKCDTCGRIETKQLSGYKNVKGTYTPTASAAAAKTTSAIPQTSDTMPIVPIAIVMIAALLGLGVTLYMKKKKN